MSPQGRLNSPLPAPSPLQDRPYTLTGKPRPRSDGLYGWGHSRGHGGPRERTEHESPCGCRRGSSSTKEHTLAHPPPTPDLAEMRRWMSERAKARHELLSAVGRAPMPQWPRAQRPELRFLVASAVGDIRSAVVVRPDHQAAPSEEQTWGAWNDRTCRCGCHRRHLQQRHTH